MDTKENAAEPLMDFCYENRPLNYTQVALKKSTSVTKSDFRRVIKERVKPFFDPKGTKAQIVVTANPTKVEGIVNGFRRIGFEDVETIDFEGMVDKTRKEGLSL